MKKFFRKFLSAAIAVVTAAVAGAAAVPVTASAGTAIAHTEKYADEAVTITMNALKTTNRIYYTLDGSKPSKQAKLYKKPVTVKKTTLIRAVEYTSKGKVAASLKLKLTPRTNPPTFSMRCAQKSVAVAINAPSKQAVVYYTTDGSEPTVKSRKFETQYPVILEPGIIIKAVCQRPGYAVSETVQFDIARDGYKVPEPMSSAEDDLVIGVFNLINDKRSEIGARQLTLDKVMCEAAAQRAAEISVCFSTRRPDGTAGSTILSDQGISCATLVEGMQLGVDSLNTPSEVFDRIMDDYVQRANAINNMNTKAGLGYYKRDNRTYWMLLFM